ncbi:unnamed protein product [Macrosiphum euphorbiae]|uniref:Endonuclease/exonuclease/phosphatase domain-containing protein n=1 Tax=Macrosiphum euphorbiae TaxID=13131 RepID=A0AAV0XCW1_9HEMI|nr:unnamed protein product [Macrosiphum euphorbiae]
MSNTRILFCNCQGVTRRRLELIDFILQQKIDILLLNETHLTGQRSINIPNYFTYTSNRPQVPGHSAGGGTAILVHRRYTHQHVVISTSSLENTTVHIQVNNTVRRLVAIYKRPANILLPADLTALLDTPYNTIVAGDLNSKHQLWFSRRPNAAGSVLAHFINSRNDLAVAAPVTPTHYPNYSNHSPDILDIAIIKSNNIQYHLENLSSDLFSDHTPIVLELHSTSASMNPPEPTHAVDWAAFQSHMDSVSHSPSSGSTTNSIDSAIKNLTTLMSNGIVCRTSSIVTPITPGFFPKSCSLKSTSSIA